MKRILLPMILVGSTLLLGGCINESKEEKVKVLKINTDSLIIENEKDETILVEKPDKEVRLAVNENYVMKYKTDANGNSKVIKTEKITK